MDMGQRIKMLREEQGLTLEELGNRVGVGKSTVRKWEVGLIANMKRDKIANVADALGVTPAYLMGWNEQENYSSLQNNTSVATINVLGRVAAGIPISAIEDIIDTEEISEKLAKTGTFFGLKINGNSMEPRICEGDVVIVRQQDDADSGDIVIALVNGDDATCKRLRKYRDGIELISLNPSYDPMFFSNDDIKNKPVKIIGKVVELRGKF